jgi:hypothetical protein
MGPWFVMLFQQRAEIAVRTDSHPLRHTRQRRHDLLVGNEMFLVFSVKHILSEINLSHISRTHRPYSIESNIVLQ